MADSFSTSVTTGFGSRIINSIKGVVVGLILFVSSFSLLYWNEGRVDLSTVAKTATEIRSKTENVDVSQNGKLVSTTGTIDSTEIIGDDLFLVPGKFIGVNRKSEMYAWVEKSDSQKSTNVGGSETTNTTYTYSQEWQESPTTSDSFKEPAGHTNPPKSITSDTKRATLATIGAFIFDPQSIDLPEFSQIKLQSKDIILSKGAILANDTYLFVRNGDVGTIDSPQVGDVRVSYRALRPGFVGTIFGKLNTSHIDSYIDQGGNQLYRVFPGTRDQAIATLHSEHTVTSWIFRLVGFLLMWFGLSALFGPISVFLDILPIFGTISRTVISIAAFVVALVLTAVTIVVSMILHNPLALGIAVIVIVGAGIFSFNAFKNKKARALNVGAPQADQPSTPIAQPESLEREIGASVLLDNEITQSIPGLDRAVDITSSNSKTKYFLIAVVVIVITVVGVGVWFVYPKLTVTNTTMSIVSEKQSPVMVVTQDPLSDFSMEFRKNNYLVQITGTDQEYYFDHGSLVHAGKETQSPGKAYFIFKKGTVFEIFPSDKTFRTFTIDSEQGKAFFDASAYAVLLSPLLDGSSKKSFEWQEVTPGTYVLKQNRDEATSKNKFPLYLQVTLNDKKLISSMSTSEDNVNWNSKMFTYELVDDLSQKIMFPFDYIKTN